MKRPILLLVLLVSAATSILAATPDPLRTGSLPQTPSAPVAGTEATDVPVVTSATTVAEGAVEVAGADLPDRSVETVEPVEAVRTPGMADPSAAAGIHPAGQSVGKEPVFTVQLHGTVRAKFEYQPDLGKSRFEVRNARFSLSGKVTPLVDYKAEIDLSDEGSIKMLDAYARLNMLHRKLRLTIGQMRVPFTIDAHRSPHEQYFANRSFIAKQAGNVRDVGATLGWSFGQTVPVTLEGGLFNGSGLTGQKDYWTRSFNYSAKARFLFTERVNLTLSIQKTHPDIVDIHMYDVGAYYENPLWHIEAEYLRKNYARDAFPGVNVVDAFVCRNVPLKSRALKQLSILARYDYMSDHSRGVADPDTGALVADDPERHRVTGGVTFSLGLPFRADIRINYEAYFYRATATPALSEQDKFVAEFMVRF
ncbi:porin [Alistipes sp.]|uniref:porin n=1 Tax=Alistipes sp. TaxID=1872444 RepID=UPI003A8C66E1